MNDEKKILEIIIKAGSIDAAHLWLLHDESFEQFFDWFKDLDEDNVTTDELVREYASLESKGLTLTEEEVSNGLELLERDYPGIRTDAESDVRSLKEQLQQLEEIERGYRTLGMDACKTEAAVWREIGSLERSLQEAEFVQEAVSQDCFECIKFVQELQAVTQQQMFDLHQCYVQSQNPSLFLYQMPIEQFNMLSVQFMKYVEMHVRKHFPLKDWNTSLEVSEDHGNSETIEQLESIRVRLDAADMRLLEKKREYHGLKKLVECTSGNRWQPLRTAELKKLCAELKHKNEQDVLWIEVLKQELEMCVRQQNQLKVECVLYENSMLKLDRAVSRHECIQQQAKIISETLMIAEMLWILLQLDLARIRDKFDNSDEMNAEAQKCLKRIDLMKSMERTTVEADAIEEYAAQLSLLLPSTAENKSDLKGCLLEFVNLKRRVQKNVDGIVDGRRYQRANEAIAMLKAAQHDLNRYVYDGPLNQPQLWNHQYFRRMQTIISLYEKNSARLKELKLTYATKVYEPKMNNKFWRYHQCLWIWFLAEPKKVFTALKEINAAASSTMTRKTLSGIKCKSNYTTG